MAYIFTNEDSASFKIEPTNSQALSLKNVNGTTNDADKFVQGVQALLWVAGGTSNLEYYRMTAGVRTVKQDVDDNT